MLEGLDVIDWSSLSHAHGPATDVPQLLRSLLSNDTDVRLEAGAELHERLWHQGTVYSASAAVVPFLFELLNRPDNCDDGGAPASRANRGDADLRPGADEMADSLLGCIATGEGWIQYGIRAVGEAAMRSTLARQGRSLEEARTEETSTLEAIHRGVAAGLQRLLPYLGNQEGLVRLWLKLLATFPSTRTGWRRQLIRLSCRSPMSTFDRI